MMSVLHPPSPAAAAADSQPTILRCHAHKFGGSSVADASRYRGVVELLREQCETRQVVVVSAMRGVTDALVALAADASAQADTQASWCALRERHLEAANALDPDSMHGLDAWLLAEFDTLRAHLDRLAKTPGADAAHIHGLGEVWSSRLLHAALAAHGEPFEPPVRGEPVEPSVRGERADLPVRGEPVEPQAQDQRSQQAGWAQLDAREVLVVHPGELGVGVDWVSSRERLAEWRAEHPQPNVVVTGFVARDLRGRPTTLGRNGSDYSGAIFAALFDARELTIWTDVHGVLSADPRLVPDAVCLDSISYAEACELAYFGAKVLHPQTMAPAMQHGMPIRIRNTLNPSAPGTLIAEKSEPAHSSVKGLSLVDELAVLELTGAGLIGVPGTAERMFAALHAAGVSVTMISQGSSEHSICCVVRAAQADKARIAITRAFADAIADGQVEGVRITPDIAVLAAVGDGMVGTPGVAARLFAGLADARVNIRAIAQGASERNISVAIAARDATRALRAAHTAFWLSPQTLSVGLIGPGKVGRALLAQLADALPRFANASRSAPKGLDLRLRAIANSRSMLLEGKRLAPAQAIDALQASGQALDLELFGTHVRAEHLPHALIVDCSGSGEVASHYPQWLAAGTHIVTANKHAGSGDWARYQAIASARRNGGHFRYEATVGAGLPVIQTLRSMLDTGDELTGIEGVLSGTLAWLFNSFDGSRPFSELVREARALGYTEPDPRDDLSGTDVARKLVILAREAGRALSLGEVEVESLGPESLRDATVEEFLARLHELDGPMQARLDAARRDGRSLRYLASLDQDGARVGVVAPEPGHASLHSRMTDNLIQIRTRRYADNPLVVQGPGAGPDVTAAGVFGDILAIAQTLGARA